jgi:hypothetical protein
VTIDSDDDRVPGGRESGVQARRSAARTVRIPYRTDPWIGRSELGDDLIGAVPGRPQGNHQFQRPQVVLIEGMRHRLGKMSLLIEHAQHDADRHVSWQLGRSTGFGGRHRRELFHLATQRSRDRDCLRHRSLAE